LIKLPQARRVSQDTGKEPVHVGEHTFELRRQWLELEQGLPIRYWQVREQFSGTTGQFA